MDTDNDVFMRRRLRVRLQPGLWMRTGRIRRRPGI